VILGFRCEVDKNCALLGYHVVSSGNSLPTFRDKLSVPSPRFKNPKESQEPSYRVYIGKSVACDKFSVAWCQPVELMKVAGRRGKCSHQCYLEARRSGRSNY
jgi:hypothetical protein